MKRKISCNKHLKNENQGVIQKWVITLLNLVWCNHDKIFAASHHGLTIYQVSAVYKDTYTGKQKDASLIS